MLFPFHGYLLGGAFPLSSTAAAARSRRIREAARRYQPIEALQRAVADGRLRRTAEPAMFRYRIRLRSGPVIDGLVGEVGLGDLLPHEDTRPSLVEPAPPVEIRPVLVVTRASLPDLRPAGAGPVVVRGTRRDEVVPLQARGSAIEGQPLVIADGHHRVRASIESHGASARIMAVVVGDSGRGLSVGTFHRRFDGVGRLPRSVADAFEVTPTDLTSPGRGRIVWVHGTGERLLLTARPEALETVPETLRGSPAAVAAACLYPLVGVGEADARYTAMADTALAALGPDSAAVLLAPASLASVMDAAEAGTPFPPKGTRFNPKPMRGLVLRLAT